MTLVVLGLDGFHKNLLQYTSFIEKLYNEQGGSTLRSTTPPVTAPAWASFQTGVNQGMHGVFDFVEYSDGQDITIRDGESLRAKPVYEWLAEEGYSCYLQNLPFALPPRIEGDIMPSWLDGEETPSVPADLTEKYNVEKPAYPELSDDTLENIQVMKDSFSTNSSIFTSILNKQTHDFFFHLVSVTDWLQHAAYLDLVKYPQSEAANAAKSLLADVDAYVERVFETVPDDVDVLLLSDHGFRLFSGRFYINDWLNREGYLVRSSDGHRFATKNENDTNVVEGGSFGYWLRKRRFWPFLRPIKNVTERLMDIKFTPEMGIDLKNSMAYCRSKDEKAIHFNHQHPDVTAETIEDIRSELDQLDYVSAELGTKLYRGPYMDEGGDIILTDESHFLNRGPVGEVTVSNEIAHHDHDGIMIGSGPSFQGTPYAPKLIDITPTILHLFGLPVPEALDGRVLEDVVQSNQSISYIETSEYEPIFKSSGRDKEEVEERLKSLGYR